MARRDDPEGAHDPSRRQFFRTFGQQTVRNAGAVMGAAAELRRASGAAARELLDMGVEPAAPELELEALQAESGAQFRSAYRLGDEELLLLDQRELPGRVSILTCSDPTEIASAIRSGVINGGPVLGEVAAYGLWIAIARAVARPLAAREGALRAAANTLRGARREVNALRWAIARMEGRFDELTADEGTEGQATDGGAFSAALAAAMLTEADAIASEAQLAHAALGRAGAETMATLVAAAGAHRPDEPINLLMHGDMGPLSCGMVGTGSSIVQGLAGLGLAVHVWVTEAAPSLEGVRIAALQLTQADVPHTVIADTAVGWLFSSRRVDAALLRGDTVTAARDTAAIIGSMNVAALAAAADVPVFVVAPRSSFNDQVEARDLVLELRSPAETLASSTAVGGRGRPAVFGVRLNPTVDIVPPALVSGFLTETGSEPGRRS
jgi:methylthioribose-1-phosphate isomerase